MTDSLFESIYLADIILPVPLPKLYTYKIPTALEGCITVGSRVIVPFGKQKVLTGIIASIHETPPKDYQAKSILDVLEDYPLITENQLKVFNWVSNYYLCHVGEVMKAALPSGLKLSSESIVQLNKDAVLDIDDFNEKERLIIDTLKQKDTLSFQEIEKLLQQKTVHGIINKLARKNSLFILDQIKEKYNPKKIKKIRLSSDFETEENLEPLFARLEKKVKQQEVLLSYLALQPLAKNQDGIEKTILLKRKISASSLRTLIKQGILEEFEVIISRFTESPKYLEKLKALSKDQQKAYDTIFDNFDQTSIQLLHGVTGSGKTEVYIHLIQALIDNGQQVLYLLPEIALTTQIVGRLRKVFGDKMCVYHSKFSDAERVETFKEISENKFQLIVGVRSSVFLPFRDLGLIIVDEEHDSSYKQYEPAPRYNARETAIMLGLIHHAKIILGTATPSVESFYNAKYGKWRYVPLLKRYGNSKFPKIKAVTTKSSIRSVRSTFSSHLFDQIKQVTDNGKQVLIFQNRRGYAPYLKCKTCEHIPSCENCNVSLTYHMYSEELRCHYCGSVHSIPTNCGACGSHQIETVGTGTEKIEEDLQLLFPDKSIARMDADTTRKKHALQQLIDDFQGHKIDILVGTQMISKGLDFDDVQLVGIFDADKILNYPDFRSSERTFQLILQVSGRAGRREQQGEVIIQVSNPNHPAIRRAIEMDFDSFYNQELNERQKFKYPPFSRIVKLIIKDEDKVISQQAAEHLYRLLRTRLGKDSVLGPEEPMINKIRNKFLFDIFVKIEKNINLIEVKDFIRLTINRTYEKKAFKKVQISIDVDPS